jgi:hypothetical protein
MAATPKKDPNKYAKNANIKADTLQKTVLSVAGIGLMMLGLIGLALEFFKEDGTLGAIWDWLWDDTTHLIAIPAVIFVLWLFNNWITSSAKGEIKKAGNTPMYIMMAIGAYYLYRFISTGGL